MKKILFVLLSLSVFSFPVFADCQLGERCNYFDNDIMLNSPYVGVYQCILDTGSMENVEVEIGLLTSNTVSDPAPLILNDNKKSGTLSVSRHGQPSEHEYLINAFRVTQTSIAMCTQSVSNHCNISATITCKQVS